MVREEREELSTYVLVVVVVACWFRRQKDTCKFKIRPLLWPCAPENGGTRQQEQEQEESIHRSVNSQLRPVEVGAASGWLQVKCPQLQENVSHECSFIVGVVYCFQSFLE